MSEPLSFHFDVDGDNFTSAGEASLSMKKNLRQLGFSPEIIRRVSIAMYEGEINMVIHAGGGEADVTVHPDRIEIKLADHGPGIENIDLSRKYPKPRIRSRHGASQYEKEYRFARRRY